MRGRAVTDINAWIDGHIHVAPCVLHRHQTCGEGEVTQQQVVFQIAADVRTVHTKGVVAIRSFDMMRLQERFPEVAADEVFIAQFGSEGCPVLGVPVEITAEAHAIDIRAVVVVFHLLGLSTIPLIAVPVLVPVDAGVEA